jgi:hypothetical protein
MANEVRILINATDNASKVMGGLKGSFTELNSALGVAEKALGYVDKAFDATVGEFTKYADQVENLGRNTGMTAEETSTLIQVADDLFVEFGSLTQAAKALKDNGLSPTIDTLAMLSDRYLAIVDPVERAKFASDNFGRSYQEMTKILEAGGDALRAAAAGQPGGLILSEEDLEANRKYKQSLDNMNDSLMAIKLTIGKKVVPAFSDFLDSLNASLAGLIRFDTQAKKFADGTEDMAKEAIKAGKSYDEFAKRMLIMKAVLEMNGQAITIPTRAEYELLAATEAATVAAEAQATSQDRLSLANANMAYWVGEQTSSLQMAYDAQMDMNQANLEGAYAANAAAIAQDLENEKLAAAQQKANDAASAIGVDLAAAYATLEQAQKTWLENVGDKAYQALKDTEGLTAQQLQIAAAALVTITGTTAVASDQMNADLAAAAAEYAKTLDVEAYKANILAIAGKFETDLAPAITAAKDEIVKLQTEMDKLSNRHIAVYVDVMYPNGPLPNANSPGGGAPDTGAGGGGGGITPPATPNFGGPTLGGGGGGIVVNMYPATQSAAAAAMNAVITMSKNQGINTRMSAG